MSSSFRFSLSFLVIAAILGVIGCAKPKSTPPASQSKTSKPDSAQPGKILNMGEGEATSYEVPPKKARDWTIRWKTARLFADSQWDPASGDLRVVTGDIFDQDQVASRFRADAGTADRRSAEPGKPSPGGKALRLSGNVSVESATQGGKLLCDALDYYESRNLIVARGRVRFLSEAGEIGTFKELRATSDLRRVGTPSLFAEWKKP